MTINAGPEFFSAEKKYFAAQTPKEQIFWLEEMIRTAPKHKSSETFVANLKQRLKKFQEKQEKAKKSGKSSRVTIRKEGFQCVLIGLPSSGKSLLLSVLTNAKPRISSFGFTTKIPEVGTMEYQGARAQILDMPSIGSDAFDAGIVNTADLIVLVTENLQDTEKLNPFLQRAYGRKIITLTKADLLSAEQKRKLEQTIKSKKLNALIISAETGEGIESLKEKIFNNMEVIRIYTKEPGKLPSKIPMILKEGATVSHAAESILKGFSKRIKETRITGPSSKFPNQRVGLSHILKDKDIIEFHAN